MKSLKLTRKQAWLLFAGINLLFFSVFDLFFLVKVESHWELQCAILCIVHAVYAVIAWKALHFSFFSPKTLFLLFLVLFHEGNLLVAAFFPMTPEEQTFCMLYRYGEEQALTASRYCILFIFMYIWLVILLEGKQGERMAMPRKSAPNLTKIGWILMLVALPTTLYTDFKMALGRISQGYAGVYEADVTFYGIPLGYFTKMFFPAIVLLLIGYRNRKKQFYKIFVVVLLYYLLRMILIGRKGDSILAIIPIVGLYAHCFKPKGKWYYLVGGYLLVFVCSLVTKMRGTAIDAGFEQMLAETVQSANPIKDILLEMGGTIKAVIQSMMAVPATGSFRGGATYIWAPIGGILSGLKISTPWITAQTQMPQFFSLPERGAYINATVPSMGGSAIGEWYLNFGWPGLILMVALVWLIIRYDKRYIRSVNNDLAFAYMNIFLFYFLRYSRAYVIELVWNPLFCIMVVAVLNYLFTKKSRRSDFQTGEPCGLSNAM